MSLDLPSGSVSGREGWDWNRLIDADQPESNPDRSTRPQSTALDPTAEQRIQTLESQLRRQEHRTQAIVDKYERLIDEKNRRLAAATTNDQSSSWLGTQLQRFNHLL